MYYYYSKLRRINHKHNLKSNYNGNDLRFLGELKKTKKQKQNNPHTHAETPVPQKQTHVLFPLEAEKKRKILIQFSNMALYFYCFDVHLKKLKISDREIKPASGLF